MDGVVGTKEATAMHCTIEGDSNKVKTRQSKTRKGKAGEAKRDMKTYIMYSSMDTASKTSFTEKLYVSITSGCPILSGAL
jgi:hypothetical protein